MSLFQGVLNSYRCAIRLVFAELDKEDAGAALVDDLCQLYETGEKKSDRALDATAECVQQLSSRPLPFGRTQKEIVISLSR